MTELEKPKEVEGKVGTTEEKTILRERWQNTDQLYSKIRSVLGGCDLKEVTHIIITPTEIKVEKAKTFLE